MDSSQDLIIARPEGLYCPPGDFYIDPRRLAAEAGVGVLLSRLPGISLQGVPYGERLIVNGVSVSLHPTGHVLGSAQVRLEHAGRVWVASGDLKSSPIPLAHRSNQFAATPSSQNPRSACRFIDGKRPARSSTALIWRHNAAEGRASVLFCYSFGKAQRILGRVDPAVGPIFCHGAVEPLNRAYAQAGVYLRPTRPVSDIAAKDKTAFKGALIIAPPSSQGSAWMRRFGDYIDAFASGWMRLRGTRRRGLDRGFVLSDHADWPGLQTAIGTTGAQHVIVTHGQIEPMVRWLREEGLEASAFTTEYGDDAIEADAAESANGTGADAADSAPSPKADSQ